MLRRLRSYEFGRWTICDVAAICLVLCIGVGCVGCLPDDLTVVLGGGNPVYTPSPIYSPPPVYVDPCQYGCGGYDDRYYDDGYDNGYYDDGYYDDDYVVIDIGVGW